MLQSHIIEVDGSFVGAAVQLDQGYRFIAVDIRASELDGTVWPSIETVKRLARQLCLTGRFGEVATPAPRSAPGTRTQARWPAPA